MNINLRGKNDNLAAFELDLLNKTGASLLVRWEQMFSLDASGDRQYVTHQSVTPPGRDPRPASENLVAQQPIAPGGPARDAASCQGTCKGRNL
ncbi:hypothetical protein DFAR_3760006 [Desulfarculales bacterium]